MLHPTDDATTRSIIDRLGRIGLVLIGGDFRVNAQAPQGKDVVSVFDPTCT
jgi:hypothetical protein